jgi:hypothetical protein
VPSQATRVLLLSLLNLAPRIGISVYGTALGTCVFDLNGKTLGVIGTGKIGLRVVGSSRLLKWRLWPTISIVEPRGSAWLSLCLARSTARVLAYHFSARGSDSGNLSPPGHRANRE